MIFKVTTLLVGLVSVFGFFVSIVNAQQSTGLASVVQLTGLAGVKDNAKGTLNVESGNLHFVHRKASADVSTTSIEDVVTGSDSQEAAGKTIGTLSMAAPYGGGRFLSLFRTKIDTLTIRYRDANGGLHGAIFTMPVGKANGIREELLASGAHIIVGDSTAAAPIASSPSSGKEPKE